LSHQPISSLLPDSRSPGIGLRQQTFPEEQAHNDPLAAACVLEVSHNFKSSSDLFKAAFYDVSGAYDPMDRGIELEEGYKAVEVSLEAGDAPGVDLLPAVFPLPEQLCRLS